MADNSTAHQPTPSSWQAGWMPSEDGWIALFLTSTEVRQGDQERTRASSKRTTPGGEGRGDPCTPNVIHLCLQESYVLQELRKHNGLHGPCSGAAMRLPQRSAEQVTPLGGTREPRERLLESSPMIAPSDAAAAAAAAAAKHTAISSTCIPSTAVFLTDTAPIAGSITSPLQNAFWTPRC